MGSKSSTPKTPEYEHVARANAMKMFNIGSDLQGQTFNGYMDSINRQTGHREAGGASADAAAVSAQQLKQVQTNPLEVGAQSLKLSANQSTNTLSAKGTASINDTSRTMTAAKVGVDQGNRNLSQQTQLATLQNNASMERFRMKQAKKQEQMNSISSLAGIGMGYGMDKYAQYQANQKQQAYWDSPTKQDYAP